MSLTGINSRTGRTGPEVVLTSERIYCPGLIRDLVRPMCTLEGAVVSIGMDLPARYRTLRSRRLRGSGCPISLLNRPGWFAKYITFPFPKLFSTTVGNLVENCGTQDLSGGWF